MKGLINNMNFKKMTKEEIDKLYKEQEELYNTTDVRLLKLRASNLMREIRTWRLDEYRAKRLQEGNPMSKDEYWNAYLLNCAFDTKQQFDDYFNKLEIKYLNELKK